MSSESLVFSPIDLPCGQTLRNRAVKAATEENMGSPEHGLAPSAELTTLYGRWAHSGVGLMLSGHVMVDIRAIAGPSPTVLDGTDAQSVEHKALFVDWISAAKQGGAKFWLQLNHPGRQAHVQSGQTIYGPSNIAVQGGPIFKGVLGTPKAMTKEQINDVVDHFVASARKAEEYGADGVQIHAAHGYLLSSFLSPLANDRQDAWGGSLEARAKLLFDVVNAVRGAVSRSFAVSVKINSADFQRGGFGEEDARWVIERLNTMNVDLIEVSGGSYEAPVMQGAETKNDRTLAREAYFLDFAEQVVQTVDKPIIMVTGGIKTLDTLDRVTRSGKTVGGIATALCLEPLLVKRWQDGESRTSPTLHNSVLPWPVSKHYILRSAALNRQLLYSMRSMANGGEPILDSSPLYALLYDQIVQFPRLRRYRRYMHKRASKSGKVGVF